MKITIKFEDIDRLEGVLGKLPPTIRSFEFLIGDGGDVEISFDHESANVIRQSLSRVHWSPIPIRFPIVRPPRLARYFLLLIPKKSREHLIGDLEEEYRTVLAQYGIRKANSWYWWQTIISIFPFIWHFLKHGLGLAVLFKLIG